MKKLLSLIIIVAFLFTSCTKPGTDDLFQNQSFDDNHNNHGGNNTGTIPAEVLSAFNARYASVTGVEWKKLSNGDFKVEFFKGAIKWQATFTANGALVKEEHD